MLKSNILVLFTLLFCTSLRTIAADSEKPPIKAIAFDAFPIFDPRPVEAAALAVFPEKGSELVKLWRTRQFEYQWLRALGGQYKDFQSVTIDSLNFAARQLDLPLTEETRRQLMAPYLNLQPWPDAAKTLQKLRSQGYKLVFLSNMTEEMLRSGIAGSGLDGLIDEIYSTDDVRSYKPAPIAYQIAPERLKLPREQILFVAFASWDVAGAKWYGFPTFWVNRAGVQPDELGVTPDGSGRDLSSLVQFLEERVADRK